MPSIVQAPTSRDEGSTSDAKPSPKHVDLDSDVEDTDATVATTDPASSFAHGKGSTATTAGDDEPSDEATPRMPYVWQPPQPAEVAEHPEGDEIRRQAEYYFSDENLPTDSHLLEKMGHNQNLPVKIKTICGFKRMRRFKPFLAVVAALKKSAFLDVLSDKTIRRKVPFILDSSDDDDSGNGDSTPEVRLPPKPQKQTTPKGNPVIPKGMLKPTGFEEFFADPPVTPAQFKEEEDIYDQEKRFTDRIEIAIQRYQQKRRFHQETARIFNHFLKFGGIDAGQRQFTGRTDDKELEGKDAGYIAQMLATHHVSYDKEDEDVWAVDFEGVAKSYLSTQFQNLCDPTPDSINRATSILRNFYNYLLHHNVCPEYTPGIYAAKDVCALAERELFHLLNASHALPGDFNVACSTLFGGRYVHLYAGDQSWNDSGGDTTWGEYPPGMREEQARIIVSLAVAVALETDAIIDYAEARGREWVKQVQCVEEVDMGLEVTAIEMPDKEVKDLYEMQSKDLISKFDLRPPGRLVCKPWKVPDFKQYDLPVTPTPPDGRTSTSLAEQQKLTFLVEEDVLSSCFVGMKMEGTVRKLGGIDVTYLDNVSNVYCSFYTILPNELVSKPFREVRMLMGKERQQVEAKEAKGDLD